MPVFKDGDTVVSESLAALQYLEQAYPEPCLVPKGSSPQVCQKMPAYLHIYQLLHLLVLQHAKKVVCTSVNRHLYTDTPPASHMTTQLHHIASMPWKCCGLVPVPYVCMG